MLRRALGCLLLVGCSQTATAPDAGGRAWACVSTSTTAPDDLDEVGCLNDFTQLASVPIDATIPGARSVKVVFDTADGTLHFQNSTRFTVHYDWVSTHRSGGSLPVVASRASFNTTEYFSAASSSRPSASTKGRACSRSSSLRTTRRRPS